MVTSSIDASSGAAPASPLAGLRRQGRLLRTDFRRSHGLILVTLMVLFGAYALFALGDRGPQEVVLWGEVSAVAAWGFAAIGPIAGGWGAYLAGRERRASTETLLASVAMPVGVTQARVLAMPVVAALLAYAVVAAFILIRAGQDSTWGGPAWPLLAIGAAFTAGYALVGTAAGMLLHQRLVPFAVAFGLFMFTVASYTWVNGNSGWSNLAPFRWVSDGMGYNQVLYRPLSTGWNAAAVPIALTAGVVVATAAVLLLARSRWRPAVGVAVLAVAILVPSVRAAVPYTGPLVPMLAPDPMQFDHAVPNPPLVCAGELVEICLHVIHRERIDEVGRIADAVAARVAGLPGTDIRIEQRADLPSTDGIMRFSDELLWNDTEARIPEIVMSALIPSTSEEGPDNSQYGPRTPVQAVIGLWLMLQSGYPSFSQTQLTTEPRHPGPGFTQADWDQWAQERDRVWSEVHDAATRFGALPEGVRSAWLAENWDAVRAGDLTLEDFPG